MRNHTFRVARLIHGLFNLVLNGMLMWVCGSQIEIRPAKDFTEVIYLMGAVLAVVLFFTGCIQALTMIRNVFSPRSFPLRDTLPSTIAHSVLCIIVCGPVALAGWSLGRDVRWALVGIVLATVTAIWAVRRMRVR